MNSKGTTTLVPLEEIKLYASLSQLPLTIVRCNMRQYRFEIILIIFVLLNIFSIFTSGNISHVFHAAAVCLVVKMFLILKGKSL